MDAVYLQELDTPLELGTARSHRRIKPRQTLYVPAHKVRGRLCSDGLLCGIVSVAWRLVRTAHEIGWAGVGVSAEVRCTT